MYAQLELQFHLIRTTSPKYSNYSYEIISHRLVQNDTSPPAVAIKKCARKAVKLYHVDMDAAENSPGIVRADVIRKLNDWNESGVIRLETSGIQHVYRALRKFPSTSGEIEQIVEKLYAYMQAREQQDLQRTKDVLNLITSARCFSRGLATYFGDSLYSMPSGCGHCTWCETHRQVVLPKMLPTQPVPALIDEVLKACSARDDPRFLARIAFGIKSPRVKMMKLTKHRAFGSMNVCDFMVSGIFSAFF